jgi:NADPH-dependent 2,4-dienoyl-CoA reductase/sulfur reductase-like enzyme
MTEAEKTHSYKKETALTNPRVVIVGGGFGGLYAARALAGAPVSVTLIDKRNYHLFRPLLYQAATGLLSADEISGPLRSILSRQNNVDVLLGEVTGVGQGRPGYRETYLCRCRPALPAICRIPRLACVGGGPHLFPHWVR